MDNKFKISSKFKPDGDQPQAIEKLTEGINSGKKFQTLLGVTGSGKTFTIANVIENIQKPTLVIAPNKTLAAQLAQEFRIFFPKSAVEYFVSYYDYYQPEAYIASSDTYIEKEAQINDEIDRLRHASTAALLSRRDVIICASVSCIYGLGSPEFYREISLELAVNKAQVRASSPEPHSSGKTVLYRKSIAKNKIFPETQGSIETIEPAKTSVGLINQTFEKLFSRKEIVKKLIEMHYVRSDILSRGKFRLTGNTLEIMTPAREIVTRITLTDEGISKIKEYDFLTGEELGNLEKTIIYPAKHFVVPEPMMEEALKNIKKEAEERVKYLRENKKLLEAERLERRTKQDIEMMWEIGYCNGIENYSRFLTGRAVGEAPYTLMDYFDKDFLLVIDESHVTVPQLNGMYKGDWARKKSLIENGFRLPSAFDNRPLKFPEFEKKINQVIFTSATPGKYEMQKSQKTLQVRASSSEPHSSGKTNLHRKSIAKNEIFPETKGSIETIEPASEGEVGIIEQIIRPTGLIDPELIVKSAKGQVKDVLEEIKKVVEKKERVLITTLTKKQAEDLSEFLRENKIKSEYLHSNVETLDRIRILEKLRRGEFDVLVGVNLLREGLDLPEVTLVAILDADKEGFLRSETSLIQTIGRAARNVSGRVILYADQITGSMRRAIDETERRRKIQSNYNKKHHITPKTIIKKIKSIVDHEIKPVGMIHELPLLESLEDMQGYIKQREKEMKDAARNLEFEKAAIIRDEIGELCKLQMK